MPLSREARVEAQQFLWLCERASKDIDNNMPQAAWDRLIRMARQSLMDELIPLPHLQGSHPVVLYFPTLDDAKEFARIAAETAWGTTVNEIKVP